MVLYEAIEVPTFGDKPAFYSVVVTCGPFEKCSKNKKVENSAIFFEEIIDLDILAPEDINQVPDIFVYLALLQKETEYPRTNEPGSRICFKRFKPEQLLYKDPNDSLN